MIKRERQFLLHSALNMQMSIPGSSKLTEDSTKATTTELSYHIKKEEIVRLIMHSLIDLGYQLNNNNKKKKGGGALTNVYGTLVHFFFLIIERQLISYKMNQASN